jgi:hypothetical protein
MGGRTVVIVASLIALSGLPAGAQDVSTGTGSQGLAPVGQAHKFLPFVTLARRAQIGLNVAGGAGWYRGDIHRDERRTDIEFDSRGNPTFVPVHVQETMSIREFVQDRSPLEMMPLGKIEVTFAAILARGFKIKAAGGFNYPGYERFSISALYFFGAGS